MSVLFCCEEENVRIDDEKGSPNSCITTTSSSSINTSPPTTTTTTTAERFHMEPVGMDKKSVEELRRFNDEGSNDDGDDDDEAESQLNGSLGSMGSLEDALPVKRGLSRFFNGKSKSFANLMDAKTIEDLKKPEPLFNKRKRILRASKSYSAVQLLSMPEEEENTDQQEPQSEHETNKKIKTEKEMNF